MALRRLLADGVVPADLRAEAAALPPGAAIIAMIHGFRYAPGAPAHDPHRHILALHPDPRLRRVMSWPRALGFGGAQPNGLGLAVGWPARASLVEAYRRAGAAGAALAAQLGELADVAGRPVALIAHSLGARVALAAMAAAPPGVVGRVILLAGAEFRCVAAEALGQPGGRHAEVLNITSRENDLFDLGFELAVAGLRRQALGLGLAEAHPRWLDVQIDDDRTLCGLEGLGYRVDGRALRLCHWSPYLRAGVFDFYRSALRTPAALPLPLLRQHLPARPAPRWSRLLAPRLPAGALRA